MKSGTTYLRKLLNAHPDIFMCEPDEPSYFVDPRHLKTDLSGDVGARAVAERGAVSGAVPAGRRRADPGRGQHQLHQAAAGAGGAGTDRRLQPRGPLHLPSPRPGRARDQPLLAHGAAPRRTPADRRSVPARPAIRRGQPLRDAAQAVPGAVRPRPRRGADPRAAGRRSGGRDARRVSMARRRRGGGRPVRLRRARERGPGRGQHAGLGRRPAAAATGAGAEERHGAAPASGPPGAAPPDHARGAPARRRRDGGGGVPSPRAAAADRRVGAAARLQLSGMDDAVWRIIDAATEPPLAPDGADTQRDCPSRDRVRPSIGIRSA